MNISSFGATHLGMVREFNEDAVLCLEDAGLWAVADGMGGHEAGDMASNMVIDSLQRLAPSDVFEDSLLRVQSLIYQANEALVHDSLKLDRHRKPGSTVVTLLLQDERGAVVWAGDSRLYRYRSGRLEQMTRDHSHVQDLVESGLIASADAESHPMANVITRAVGIDVPMDLATREFRVLSGDRFLLCSDGLSRTVSNEEICEAMGLEDSQAVVEHLLPITLERGAPDNVSIISVVCSAD